MNESTEDCKMPDLDYSHYTDEELTKAWNYLETCRLSDYVQLKMDRILSECQKRGIVSWNENSEIIERDFWSEDLK